MGKNPEGDQSFVTESSEFKPKLGGLDFGTVIDALRKNENYAEMLRLFGTEIDIQKRRLALLVEQVVSVLAMDFPRLDRDVIKDAVSSALSALKENQK